MAKQKRKSKFAGKVSGDVKRQKSAASSYGYLKLPKDVNVFSPEPGSRVHIDIMPYVVTDSNHPDRNDDTQAAMKGDLWYKRPFKTHRNIGAENDTVVCLTSFGKKCPICEYRTKRMKEGAEKEELDSLKASMRNLYIVIPIGHKKFDEKPHIFDISQWLFQNLLNDELEEDSDYEVFPDLEDGFTLKVRFDSKSIGKGNAFAEASRIDFLERDEAYDESILDEIPSLDDVLQETSYAQLQAKFFENEDEEIENEDLDEDPDDAPPAPTRRKKKKIEDDDEEDEKPVSRRKKREPEPEPEEDDDPDEDEEEEKPVRRKPARRKPEPEPEEDDDPEPEEEKPVRRKKPQSEKPAKKGKDNPCPHGYKFGEDNDQYPECAECDVWDDCAEAHDNL